jgi:hypothetical protein
VNAPGQQLADTERRRDAALDRYKVADANISDLVGEKEAVEGYLELVVIGLFALGSLLAGFGRAMEMVAAPERI